MGAKILIVKPQYRDNRRRAINSIFRKQDDYSKNYHQIAFRLKKMHSQISVLTNSRCCTCNAN
ncbi:hypothetical protein DMH88_16970 [Escherichia coli]|nr:hypothetical protein [Escherichia coli]